MAHRFLHVAIHFGAGAPIIAPLEPVMHTVADDWIRYAANTWILWTDKTPAYVANTLRLHLPTQQFLIFPIDRTDETTGFAQQWVWDWINRTRPRVPGVDYPGALAGYLPQLPRLPSPPSAPGPLDMFPFKKP
jgi:hypothetical protein